MLKIFNFISNKNINFDLKITFKIYSIKLVLLLYILLYRNVLKN